MGKNIRYKDKYKKRAAIIVSVALLIVSIMSGCSYNTTTKKVNDKKKDISIGLCFDSFVIERWLRDRDAFVTTAKELGAKVNVQNANGDVNEQISQIKYLISKKVDVIVVIAVDCEKVSDIVKKAKDEGINVISYDRLIKNAGTDLYISFDNGMIGKDMATAMKQALPKGGKIFAINGPKTDSNVAQIENAFNKDIKKAGIDVVYSQYCTGWSAKIAGEYAEEALKKYPDVDGIMCSNDDMASEVSRVLSENRLAGKVALIGQDADLLACQRIVENTQNMTEFKRVEDLAKAAAYFAVKMARGQKYIDLSKSENEQKKLKKDNKYIASKTISDGENEVPYYSLKPVMVTKNNIDKIIIDSGFHTKEEVYLNMED
ncbi:substrate-binding domain-containing protein [Eubacterium sp. MSJ-13]|uniref:sugar ABC transporter substrate-binding protein n=1 Tax=Eubacterium sp. MSJ-13 TaxID=2841513 RepID=UPI001C126563|nr:substrate-binding domain-containing protein [Eubacterium sp. MSJ-13]MBU5479534.1 substrate-binding domain-containing protein [Eubacterium sp. MSJ-13]